MPRPLTLREVCGIAVEPLRVRSVTLSHLQQQSCFSPRYAPKEDTDGARLGLASIRHCSSHPFDLSVRTDYAN